MNRIIIFVLGIMLGGLFGIIIMSTLQINKMSDEKILNK